MMYLVGFCSSNYEFDGFASTSIKDLHTSLSVGAVSVRTLVDKSAEFIIITMIHYLLFRLYRILVIRDCHI